MVSQYRIDLERAFSKDRLAAYASADDDDLATIISYFWNMALCQSLYPCLGTLEVTVRNSIHRTLTDHFGRPDWYDRPALLQHRELRNVQDAKRKIRDSNRVITPGRVVAALTFGFWTSLLSKLYGNARNGPKLWTSPNSRLLITAFPTAPGHASGVRGPIFNRLDDIRRLRNRIFHFERIVHGIELPGRGVAHGSRIVPITDMHVAILETIGWVDPTVAATVEHLDTFRDTFATGQTRIEADIAAYLATR